MVKCSKCNKRYAVVFVTKIEDGEKKTEGLCLQCARELGVPVDDIMGDQLKKFGISPEQMEELEKGMSELAEAENLDDLSDDENPALPDDGGAPSINIQKIINEAFGNSNGKHAESKESSTNKKEENKPKRDILDRYCKNLTDMARKGRLDHIVGRENEIARVIQILCRRQKNNPCLIGEPGVGKTAIAEALAQRIAGGDVPYRLKKL